MDNKDKEVLKSFLNPLFNTLDPLHVHPKTKLLPYYCYVLSTISWHFTVTDLGKTWISENLDNIVSKNILQWLELHISATLSSIALPANKFSLAFQLPSVKYRPYQTVLQFSLKFSKDEAIVRLRKNTTCGATIQYKTYKNTKYLLKLICTEHTDCSFLFSLSHYSTLYQVV